MSDKLITDETRIKTIKYANILPNQFIQTPARPKYSIAHLISTRYFVKNLFISERNEHIFNNLDKLEKYFKDRASIFLEFCYPSIINQLKDQDLWLLIISEEYKKIIIKYLPNLDERIKIVDIKEHDEIISEFRRKKCDYITHTRIDNDDALASDYFIVCDAFISRIEKEFGIVVFPHGMQYNKALGLNTYISTSPHFLTSFIHRGCNVFLNVFKYGDHSKIHYNKLPLYECITNLPMWLEHIHSTNIGNIQREYGFIKYENFILTHRFNYNNNLKDIQEYRDIPEELSALYTLNYKIPLKSKYENDDLILSQNVKNKDAITIDGIHEDEYSLHNETLDYLCEAFRQFPLTDKRVMVYGLNGYNLDTLVMYSGAKSIIIVDNTEYLSHDPNIQSISKSVLNSSLIKVDYIISLTAIAKEGFGFDNEVLNPDGDLNAIQELRKYLEPNGYLFLSVPVGEDLIMWNSNRIYGPIRLPMLLEGWNYQTSFGLKDELFRLPCGQYTQPVIILAKNPMALCIPQIATHNYAGQIEAINKYGAFDRDYYIYKYPDTLSFGGDSISHYVLYVADENRNPTAWFDSNEYKELHPYLKLKNINPFLYYLLKISHV